MDILEKYNQELREEQYELSYRQTSEENDYFLRLIVRLSRGRIQNARQATYVLIIAIIILPIISLLIIFGLHGSSPTVPLLQEAHPSIRIKK